MVYIKLMTQITISKGPLPKHITTTAIYIQKNMPRRQSIYIHKVLYTYISKDLERTSIENVKED